MFSPSLVLEGSRNKRDFSYSTIRVQQRHLLALTSFISLFLIRTPRRKYRYLLALTVFISSFLVRTLRHGFTRSQYFSIKFDCYMFSLLYYIRPYNRLLQVVISVRDSLFGLSAVPALIPIGHSPLPYQPAALNHIRIWIVFSIAVLSFYIGFF